MKFRYQAFDRAGAAKAAVIEAASLQEAGDKLRQEGLFVSTLAEVGDSVAAAGSGARFRGLGVGRAKHVAQFVRQLSVLVGTGTRLADALVAMEKQCRDPGLRSAIGEVRARVEEGQPFADGLASQPAYFDTVAVNLVRAGESSGRLDAMLKRLAEITVQQLRVRQTVVGAMVYPVVLIAISIKVLLAMMFFVLPRFTGLFESLGVPLPPTTRALLWTSGVLLSYWWAILVATAGVVAVVVMWVRSPAGRDRIEQVLLSAPLVGRMLRSFVTARIARLLGLLMEAKVPLLEALSLVGASVGTGRYRALLAQAAEDVQRGESLSVCLGRDGLLEISVVEGLRSAERTGNSGQVLSSMADFLDEENRTNLKTLTSLIEPAILITLGVVVGFIAISLFLPLFDLTSAGSGGAH